MQKLNGKTALVTGGGRGIGAAIARAMASEGAHVTITYANSEKRAHAVVAEIENAGGKACAIHADNKAIEDIKTAINYVVDRQGQFDILINNAGVFHAAPIDQLSQENYDDTMNVNVRAVFFCNTGGCHSYGRWRADHNDRQQSGQTCSGPWPEPIFPQQSRVSWSDYGGGT